MFGRKRRRPEEVPIAPRFKRWHAYEIPLQNDLVSDGESVGGMCGMVVDCCRMNDMERLRAFFSVPSVADQLLQSEPNYSFRLMARQLLRLIGIRQIEGASILVRHLAQSLQRTTPEDLRDLHRRLGKQLFTHFADDRLRQVALSWARQLAPTQDVAQTSKPHQNPSAATSHPTAIESAASADSVPVDVCEDGLCGNGLWGDFLVLYENAGGDGRVWLNMRAARRAMIAHRLFCANKAGLNETYAPYFSDRAYSPECISILARRCKIIVSRGQISRNLFKNTNDLSHRVLNAVLASWRIAAQSTKSPVAENCRFNCDDVQRLLLIGDKDRRRTRLDLVTSVGPPVSINAEQLQRFQLSGFPDQDNPVPWIHTHISINRDMQWDWNGVQIIAFYLRRQHSLRQTAAQAYSYQIDRSTGLVFPPELLRIISEYLVSNLADLVHIDPASVSHDDAATLSRIWTPVSKSKN